MTSSYEELRQISRSQTRQQIALILFSIVLAASTIITWRSVATLREANEIQRELLALQKADSPPKAPVKRRSSARQKVKARVDSHRSSNLSDGQERNADHRPAPDSAPATRAATSHASLERQGRQ